MKNRFTFKLAAGLFAAACLLGQSGAYAADEVKTTTETNNNGTQKSTTEAKGNNDQSQVGITHFALRPTAGAIFFNGTQRFAGGVLADFNLVQLPWMKIGPAFGALYSSLSGSNFFDGVSTSNNDYIFQLPANLKVTFAPDNARRLQLGVHGGANIIRSNSGVGGAFGGTTVSSNLGTTAGGSTWDVHPNFGGDIDFALGTAADLTLRPDLTLMNAFNMFSATLGLALKL
ncbi:MAG: hypothetical protein HY075_08375 [Deltaproteobacteria bacterium]|nr:hypothetical protein [Deltaproteobacteria bacterium]